MKTNLEIALEECLALLAKGESLAACLQRYPQEAAELTLLLQIAKGIEGLRPQEPVSASVAARQRRLFLQRAAALEQEEQTTSQGFLAWLPLVRMPVPARMALAAATVFALTLIIGAGAVLASGGDLGEVLLQLIPEPLQEALGLEVEETPVPEVVEVEFSGTIESIGEGSWVISGQTVLVDANTMVEGTPQVGLTAEVTALSQPDGSLLATHIEIQEPEFVDTPTIGDPDDGVEAEEDEEEAEEEEEAEDEAEEDADEDADEEEDADEDEGEDGEDEDGGESEDEDDEEDDDDEDEVTAQEAAAAILAAHAGILEAQAAINAAPEGVDISTAQEKVEEAQEKLGEAEALYAAGDYAAVVDKAEDASQLADDALDALADAAEDVEEEEDDDEEEDTDDGNEESNDGS